MMYKVKKDLKINLTSLTMKRWG